MAVLHAATREPSIAAVTERDVLHSWTPQVQTDGSSPVPGVYDTKKSMRTKGGSSGHSAQNHKNHISARASASVIAFCKASLLFRKQSFKATSRVTSTSEASAKPSTPC